MPPKMTTTLGGSGFSVEVALGFAAATRPCLTGAAVILLSPPSPVNDGRHFCISDIDRRGVAVVIRSGK